MSHHRDQEIEMEQISGIENETSSDSTSQSDDSSSSEEDTDSDFEIEGYLIDLGFY